jgi:hypothetical protein
MGFLCSLLTEHEAQKHGGHLQPDTRNRAVRSRDLGWREGGAIVKDEADAACVKCHQSPAKPGNEGCAPFLRWCGLSGSFFAACDGGRRGRRLWWVDVIRSDGCGFPQMMRQQTCESSGEKGGSAGEVLYKKRGFCPAWEWRDT